MNKSFKLVKQQGASLVLTVMMLTGILGFFALAIDVGYLFVVRNQLQNAADSAALSGANYLYPLESTSPNWSLASSKATTTVQQNKVDNIALAVGTINTGYWNITGSPTGLHASKSDAISSSNYDYPAVQVTITKTATNAVVNTFFAGVLGIKCSGCWGAKPWVYKRKYFAVCDTWLCGWCGCERLWDAKIL